MAIFGLDTLDFRLTNVFATILVPGILFASQHALEVDAGDALAVQERAILDTAKSYATTNWGSVANGSTQLLPASQLAQLSTNPAAFTTPAPGGASFQAWAVPAGGGAIWLMAIPYPAASMKHFPETMADRAAQDLASSGAVLRTLRDGSRVLAGPAAPATAPITVSGTGVTLPAAEAVPVAVLYLTPELAVSPYLSRSAVAGLPEATTMHAPLDLGGNPVTNAGNVSAQSVTVSGSAVVNSLTAGSETVGQVNTTGLTVNGTCSGC